MIVQAKRKRDRHELLQEKAREKKAKSLAIQQKKTALIKGGSVEHTPAQNVSTNAVAGTSQNVGFTEAVQNIHTSQEMIAADQPQAI